MSDLRDARLRRALESAPDADQRPDQRTRRAVLDAARQAVGPAPRAAWWAKLWQGMGDRNMPWNAALATVVIATLVTVLWYDREVPQARPDAASTSEPAPAAAPPVVSSSAPPAAAPAPRPAPAPARKPQTATKPQSQPAPAPAEQTESPRERRAEVAVDAMLDQGTRELAKSGPSTQSPEPAKQADVAAAARAPAPAAAPAAPAPALSRAAPAGLASQAEAPVTGNWTHLRIAAQGRRVELARAEAPRLAQLLDGVAREARDRETLQATVVARFELTDAGNPAGVIELAGPQVRWTPAGGRSLTGRPDEARLQALREEIIRAMQR